ncbi:condensation domain-containing protein, partial [Longimicrobium sp.]|uniref:condensation domain-containing protein n=1 Tax=Longimicrobium sp. TaxID=2029185 RepID=UPI002E2F815D
PSPLADLPVQFADYAAWQRASLGGEAVDEQLAYWTRRLAGAPSTLDLPTDRPRPAVQDLRGGTHVFALSAEAVRGVRTLAAAGGATTFMVLAAAFASVLRRWSGQDDVVIGTPVIHRPRRELEGLIGFFSNTLPLRIDLADDPDFRTLLGRVRETTLDAYAHQDVPFEQVVDALGVERSLSHSPVFQVMLTHQTAIGGGAADRRLGDLSARPAGASLGTSRFDMTVGIGEAENGIFGDVEFAAALWDAETVARLIGHLDATLRAVAQAPDAPVSSHDVLTAEERALVVGRWNATHRASAAGVCVHDRFAQQATLTPDAPAVDFGGRTLTYA